MIATVAICGTVIASTLAYAAHLLSRPAERGTTQ
jgi:hypothetical protein